MSNTEDLAPAVESRRLPSPDRHSAPTPLDVRQAKFNTAMRGYEKSEVNAFLLETADGYEQALRENDRLRQMIQMKPQTAWKPRLAKVVGRDPANWWRTVQIDLGSADGLQVNLPVMTSQGLVGRVYAVGQHRALVVLVGSAECRVAAVVDHSAWSR